MFIRLQDVSYEIELNKQEYEMIYTLLANINSDGIKAIGGNDAMFNFQMAKRLASDMRMKRVLI